MSIRLSEHEFNRLNKRNRAAKSKTAQEIEARTQKEKAFEFDFFSEAEFFMAREGNHFKRLKYLQAHPDELKGHFEHAEQTFVMHYFDVHHPDVFEMMFAIPNAGLRTRMTRGLLLAEGLKNGIPDIYVDIAVEPYHGLRLELKRSTETIRAVRENQWEWIRKYEAQGYKACAVIGYRECILAICDYFSLPCRFRFKQHSPVSVS